MVNRNQKYEIEIRNRSEKILLKLKELKSASKLKYPGEERAKEKRVTIEVTLDS